MLKFSGLLPVALRENMLRINDMNALNETQTLDTFDVKDIYIHLAFKKSFQRHFMVLFHIFDSGYILMGYLKNYILAQNSYTGVFIKT